MRVTVALFATLVLSLSMCALAETNDLPQIKKFVAPAYPRLARDARMQGTATFRLVVTADGNVKNVQSISAHPIFAKYSLPVLEQWKFESSNSEHILDVTIVFEFDTTNCEGTNVHPATSETWVSAELPSKVKVSTGLPCTEITTSDIVRR